MSELKLIQIHENQAQIDTKFSDLKYVIDYDFAQKLLVLENYEERKMLSQLWSCIIDKIESIESECMRNSILIRKKNFNTDQIDQLELESQLFMNKTLLYLTQKELAQMNLIDHMRSCLTGKLLIIKNFYVRSEILLNINTNDSISSEYIICKQIEKIFENLTEIQSIQEIEINLDLITKIDLTYSNIKSIDSNTFKNVINLTRIDLAHNQLTSIDSNLLNDLNKLTYIGLNNNRISKLGPNLFKNKLKLQYIYLNYNRLTDLDYKQFDGLSELTHLYLNNNELKCLDKTSLNSLLSLEFIELSNNLIRDLDKNLFTGLFKLKTINLCNNLLTSIHSSLFNSLTDLRSLFISSNQLTKLDSITFKGLNNLDKLFLDDNLIESLDGNLFDELSNLTYLNLANNQLKRIEPGLFRHVSKLTLLYLNSNKLNKNEINTSELASLTKLNQIRMDEKSICCFSDDSRIFQMSVPIEYF